MYERFRRLFRYEQDANAKVLASLATVPPANRASAEFSRAMTIFGHIIEARSIWLARLHGPAPAPASMFPAGLTLEDAARRSNAADGAWREWCDHLSDAKLRQAIDYVNSEQRRFRVKVEDVLGHVLMHSAYHRGQIAMLVRQSGGEPAATDYVIFARDTL